MLGKYEKIRYFFLVNRSSNILQRKSVSFLFYRWRHLVTEKN